MYQLTFTYKGIKGIVRREDMPTKVELERYYEQVIALWIERQEKTAPILDEK